MKGLKKKFALVLAFVAVFAMCGSALAKDIYVAKDGTGDGTSPESAYGSVKDAINNAEADDVIKVGPGRFEVENITINKVLEISGAGATGTDAEKTTFHATLTGVNGDKSMIMISGDNLGGVKISGICFEITSSTNEGRNEDDVAISYRASGTPEKNIVITECAFIGKSSPETEKTQAIAISSTTGRYLTFSNNTLENMKYGMYFNQINDVVITGNVVTNTQYNAINIAADRDSRQCSNITITGNTMSNIATADWYMEEYSSGVRFGDYVTPGGNTVTDNEINMADPSKQQEYALSGTTIPQQVAQVVTPDESNVYFATLADAVASDKTTDGSTITLTKDPVGEDAQTVIDKNVTIKVPEGSNYTPVVAEGGELIKNDDGTFTVKAPANTSGGGGGGCSAGFGALALLAAVPLLFRRKK